MTRRFVIASAAASVGLLAFAGSASAHIEPDPSEAQAGSTLTVGFTVQHGCDDSPTVQIEMRLPEGVTDAVAEPIDGWTESVDDEGVAMFEGGSLPADEAGTFEITMTLPPTPDTTIYFPFVQRCEVGETRWIALPDDSGDEPDEPAPALDLVGPVVTTTAPATTVADDVVPATDAPVDTTATTTDPATPTTSDATAPDATAPGDTVATTGIDEDGNSNIGTIAFIISVLAVLVIGAIVYFTARRNRLNNGGEGADPADTAER